MPDALDAAGLDALLLEVPAMVDELLNSDPPDVEDQYALDCRAAKLITKLACALRAVRLSALERADTPVNGCRACKQPLGHYFTVVMNKAREHEQTEVGMRGCEDLANAGFITEDEAADPQPAVAAGPDEMAAWLIETKPEIRAPGLPLYFAGNELWTKDAGAAVRFSRKEDAEALLASDIKGLGKRSQMGWAHATEHMWLDGPSPEAARPAATDGDAQNDYSTVALIHWLRKKYLRHGELEDDKAADTIATLEARCAELEGANKERAERIEKMQQVLLAIQGWDMLKLLIALERLDEHDAKPRTRA